MAKQARGQQTVGRVLDAAQACFAQRSNEPVGVKDIAARAGVSIGSLYHHFGSSEGVVLALYKRCLASLLIAVSQSALRHAPARAFLFAFVSAYLGWVDAHPDEAWFLYLQAPGALGLSVGAELASFKEPLLRPLRERLARYVAEGKLVSLPEDYYEIVVVGPMAELARRHLSREEEGLDLRAGGAVLQHTLWNALRVRKSPRRS